MDLLSVRMDAQFVQFVDLFVQPIRGLCDPDNLPVHHTHDGVHLDQASVQLENPVVHYANLGNEVA